MDRQTDLFSARVVRRLILLRHAQTADKQPGQRDYDRGLTPDGEAQARKTGQYFVLKSFRTDRVLCSGARRARGTATLLGEATGIATDKYHWADELYEADGDTWMGFIRQLPGAVQTVLCVGHNPVLSWLASHLSQRPLDLAPTGFVVYESPAESWSTFDRDIREVFTMIKP